MCTKTKIIRENHVASMYACLLCMFIYRFTKPYNKRFGLNFFCYCAFVVFMLRLVLLCFVLFCFSVFFFVFFGFPHYITLCHSPFFFGVSVWVRLYSSRLRKSFSFFHLIFVLLFAYTRRRKKKQHNKQNVELIFSVVGMLLCWIDHSLLISLWKITYTRFKQCKYVRSINH